MPARRLKLFANFIQSDPDVTYIERVWRVGGMLSAPFASRPNDELGLGLGRLEINDDARRRLREQGDPVPDVEYPAELYYRVAHTPLADAEHPVLPPTRGFDDDKDVVVVGLKTVVSF